VTKHPQTNAVALVAVPIVGTVAAGHPIFAHEKITSKVLIEASVVGSGKCFALYTLGDSIIDAGIAAGAKNKRRLGCAFFSTHNRLCLASGQLSGF
jgi:repressor LexA